VVTAKLSQKFYERFGEDVTNELVNWFNAVDATYRSELRDLNEVNFARFDAKLEQRLAQFDAKLEQRLAQLDAKWEGRWHQLDAKWEGRWHQIDAKLAELKSDLLKWMFLFWATTGVALGGLFFRK
jgi:hypothetical protein